tara:strand:- start:1253 stop:2647 length:1395 start_codon:yes stop_codon:yes gene_type:complete
MATRKSLVLVSGLFEELDSSSDKLDFAGNTTADLTENTNLYYTDTRSRAAVSVTDSGGDGGLSYDNSTGVITYTGPSASEVRAHISVASGSGLTYNFGTGELGTSAIPNAQLANSSLTVGSTSINLGATATTIAGLSALTSTTLTATTLISGVADAANAISIAGGNITFEGSSADTDEIILTAADASGGDKTITLPNTTGTVALTSDIVYPVTLTNSVTLTNKTLALGSNTISGTTAEFNTALTDGSFATLAGSETLTNKSLTAPTLTGSSTSAGSIIFKEDTDNGTNSATLVGPASTADVTITLPAETGTVLTSASSIANSNLANSTITIGSSSVALGSSQTTFTGLASITSTAVVTNDSGFRVRNNSDNTKVVALDCSGITGSTTRTLTIPDQDGTIALVGGGSTEFADNVFRVTDNGDSSKKLAFECSGITGSTTRTMTVPDSDGTISTESFATAIAVALG